ncbi:hypothetical protein NWF32_00005 [Pseudomonas qingdaonensis]|nr:hypothetical protein [Pseudomonas qingdaonensis]
MQRYSGVAETTRALTSLPAKFDLASQTVCDIIARQRELHRRAEPDLFGYEEHPRDCTNHPQSP